MTKRPYDAKSGDRAHISETLLGAVEKQLADGTPKEVGGTLIRLCFLGYSRGEALRLIAIALTLDMKEMLQQGRAYDEVRYVAKLHALPELAEERGPGIRLQ
jgi:hypothetical protein